MAKRKLISTVYYNQEEILNAISYLYMGGNFFEVDPCYGKGNLYAGIHPKAPVGKNRTELVMENMRNFIQYVNRI